jgi:hypothetical protein
MKKAAILVALVVVSCSSPVCGCSFPIPGLVVTGTVIDALAMPVSGAEVEPVGNLRVECIQETTPPSSYPFPATTDLNGLFSMQLFVGGEPGDHCFDLSVASPGLGVADTVRDIEGTFDYGDTDTLSLVLTVSW